MIRLSPQPIPHIKKALNRCLILRNPLTSHLWLDLSRSSYATVFSSFIGHHYAFPLGHVCTSWHQFAHVPHSLVVLPTYRQIMSYYLPWLGFIPSWLMLGSRLSSRHVRATPYTMRTTLCTLASSSDIHAKSQGMPPQLAFRSINNYNHAILIFNKLVPFCDI